MIMSQRFVSCKLRFLEENSENDNIYLVRIMSLLVHTVLINCAECLPGHDGANYEPLFRVKFVKNLRKGAKI